MVIGGVEEKYCQNSVTAVKIQKDINSAERFSLEKTGNVQELSIPHAFTGQLL